MASDVIHMAIVALNSPPGKLFASLRAIHPVNPLTWHTQVWPASFDHSTDHSSRLLSRQRWSSLSHHLLAAKSRFFCSLISSFWNHSHSLFISLSDVFRFINNKLSFYNRQCLSVPAIHWKWSFLFQPQTQIQAECEIADLTQECGWHENRSWIEIIFLYIIIFHYEWSSLAQRILVQVIFITEIVIKIFHHLQNVFVIICSDVWLLTLFLTILFLPLFLTCWYLLPDGTTSGRQRRGAGA